MKIVDGILVVISIIAFVGAVVTAYILAQVGAAIQSFGGLGDLGVAGVSDAINLFNTMLLFGWIWDITVILSSLYAIWVGIKRIRSKK